MGVADVNRTGTGVSMGAVWGDYDNDGFEDLFVYKYGRPELFHNEQGRCVRRGRRARRACREWVNANSAVWLDYDRDGRLDLFVAGYWPEDVDLWHLEDDADHAGELRVREQRRPEVPVPQSRRRHVRGRVGGARHRPRAAGRWRSAPPICSAPAIPICSSRTTTASRSSSPTADGKRFEEVGARDRRRAARRRAA